MDGISFTFRGWTVNEIPFTPWLGVGSGFGSRDRHGSLPGSEAPMPSSPSPRNVPPPRLELSCAAVATAQMAAPGRIAAYVRSRVLRWHKPIWPSGRPRAASVSGDFGQRVMGQQGSDHHITLLISQHHRGTNFIVLQKMAKVAPSWSVHQPCMLRRSLPLLQFITCMWAKASLQSKTILTNAFLGVLELIND